jgi:hypothetical protein
MDPVAIATVVAVTGNAYEGTQMENCAKFAWAMSSWKAKQS